MQLMRWRICWEEVEADGRVQTEKLSETEGLYRMIGNPFLEQRLVSFQIQEALPIENGKVLDGTVSPTFALCRAEGSPSQNNPTPEEKADSGAM